MNYNVIADSLKKSFLIRKKKNLLLIAVASIGLTTATVAQTVPSYVPTSGLVGWWPFNGNAIDESINTNDGTVNGATLTADRFGNANKAYSFNGTNNFIKINNGLISNTFGSFSFSFWFKTNTTNIGTIMSDRGSSNWAYKYSVQINNNNNIGKCAIANHDGASLSNFVSSSQSSLNQNNWVHCIGVLNSSSLVLSIYINGILSSQTSSINPNAWNVNTTSTYIGKWISPFGDYHLYNGIIDDIGIWNRALTQQEITALYNGANVGINDISIENQFSIFPNPAQNVITIKATTKLDGSAYSIYDNMGRVLASGKLNGEITMVELGHLAAGIYTLRVGDNLKQTFKIVKE